MAQQAKVTARNRDGEVVREQVVNLPDAPGRVQEALGATAEPFVIEHEDGTSTWERHGDGW